MATKKKNTRKSTSSHKKSTGSVATKELTPEQKSAQQQVHALILLAVSILVFCLAVIKGEALWTWLHNFILGMFSYSACIVPIILAFVAVMLAMEKDVAGLKTRMWQSAVFALLLNSTIYAFAVDSRELSFFKAIGACYVDGKK